MDVHLYDYNFNELAVTDRVLSANWNLFFNAVGTGEYHFDIDNPILKILLESKYLFIHQDNAEYELFGVVVGVTFGEDIAVFCRTLNWFLTKMLSPPVTDSGLTTAAVKAAQIFGGRVGCDIDAGVFSEDDDRKFYFWRDGYGTLFDYISEVLANVNAGHTVRLNAGRLVFDMILPSETELYISINDGSAGRIEIVRDVIDYSNAGFYKKENASDNTGEWTEYKSVETNKLKQWYALLDGSDNATAQASLSKKKAKNTTSATVQRLEYLSDYALGDIVTVQVENEHDIISAKQQITSVRLNWDADGFSQQPQLTELNEFEVGKPPETEEEETT